MQKQLLGQRPRGGTIERKAKGQFKSCGLSFSSSKMWGKGTQWVPPSPPPPPPTTSLLQGPCPKGRALAAGPWEHLCGWQDWEASLTSPYPSTPQARPGCPAGGRGGQLRGQTDKYEVISFMMWYAISTPHANKFHSKSTFVSPVCLLSPTKLA